MVRKRRTVRKAELKELPQAEAPIVKVETVEEAEKPVEQTVSTKAEESLEDTLLDIYHTDTFRQTPKHRQLRYLMEKTGASEVEVIVTWHHLFDKHKIAEPSLTASA